MAEVVAMADSERIDTLDVPRFISNVKKNKKDFCSSLRPLSSSEIKQLTSQGNFSENWEALRVHEKFVPDFIRNNRFIGNCCIGVCNGTPHDTGIGFSLPSAITDSTLINTAISNGCCIWNVKVLFNYYIDASVVLVNIGTLSCSSTSTFGNGRELVIGIETGGREVLSFADITVDGAYSVATKKIPYDNYKKFIAAYTDLLTIGYGIVGKDCRIVNCPEITDSLIAEATTCENVLLISNSTILSSSEEPTSIRHGAFLRNSCVQFGCSIDSMAIVDDSILTEHSHVERHGKVTHSILGPNTGIAEGEVTASLVGPFVGFHHQSLLIGALWPQGKGNVAYGANVGSNHTAKAPDQEIYCGEGMFFGLGTSIKYPADYSRAPYSIIATGVITLPQRVTFPFSLINTPSKSYNNISPAYNELIPAWVLSDNLYLVKRNEAKFASRNKARRTKFSLEIFRPEIIDLLVDARMRCNNISSIKEFYTEADLPGTGKNFVTRTSLQKAINTYSLHIEYYCLKALFEQCRAIIESDNPGSIMSVFTDHSGNFRWEHCRKLGLSEGLAHRSINENFDRLGEISEQMVKLIVTSKEKDDIRGNAIMDDYASAHTCAENDPFVKETIRKNHLFLQDVQNLRKQLASGE
jgi:hypothetical protein